MCLDLESRNYISFYFRTLVQVLLRRDGLWKRRDHFLVTLENVNRHMISSDSIGRFFKAFQVTPQEPSTLEPVSQGPR